MQRNDWVRALLLGVAVASLPDAARADDLPAGAIRHDAQQLQWVTAPPAMPAGTRMALLEGNPKSEGLFTLRLQVPAGARLAPHRHPRDERVTVLSGRVGIGFGEHFDQDRLRYIEAGGFYLNPTPVPHFVFFPVESVVQITGIGPWQTQWLDAPDNGK
jgi:quercetin dioxygenase-like cupin family protein